MNDILLVIAGFVLLFVGGEALVRGSVAISKRLGISALFIGVVVIGFGTSAPELLVSIQATLAEQPDIALGNIIGSNIANILLTLGVAATITPIICKDKAIARDSLVTVIASIVLLGLAYLQVISRLTGGVMVLSLVAYLFYSLLAEKKSSNEAQDDTVYAHETEQFSNHLGLLLSILISVVGIGMLVLGADWLVEGASNLAREAGISEAVIGLSLVAIGTSLPELATAIIAAAKKQTDVIIGNVLGSNLFNVFSILGISALVKPLAVSAEFAKFDIPLALLTALLTFVLIVWRKQINKPTGIAFLIAYIAYISWIYMD